MKLTSSQFKYRGLIVAMTKALATIGFSGWLLFEVRDIAAYQRGVLPPGLFSILAAGVGGGASSFSLGLCAKELRKLRDENPAVD